MIFFSLLLSIKRLNCPTTRKETWYDQTTTKLEGKPFFNSKEKNTTKFLSLEETEKIKKFCGEEIEFM